MKRMNCFFYSIISVCLCFVGILRANGQDTLASDSVALDSATTHHFHFIYIDHEPDTPIGLLCKRVEKLHNDVLETGDKLIVYLSNEESPLISYTNIENKKDSINTFYKIIDELQGSTYHEVNSSIDNDSIKSLIGIDGLIPIFKEGDSDLMQYASVSLDFYIGKRFWSLRYNEKLLAALYVSLQFPYYIQKCPATRLSFNVFKPKDVVLIHPEKKPFGESNLGNINENVNILEY